MDMMMAEDEDEMDMDDDDEDEDDEDDSDDENHEMLVALYEREHNKRVEEEEKRKRAALEESEGEDRAEFEANKEKGERSKTDDSKVAKMEVDEDVAVDPDVLALKAALEEENAAAAAPAAGRAKRSSTAAATKASNAAAATRSAPSRVPSHSEPPSEVTLDDVQNKLSRIGTNISVSGAPQTVAATRGRRSSSTSSSGKRGGQEKSAKSELPAKDEDTSGKIAELPTKSENPSECSEAVKKSSAPAVRSSEPKSQPPKDASSKSNGSLTTIQIARAPGSEESKSQKSAAVAFRRRKSSSSSSSSAKHTVENGEAKMSNGISGSRKADVTNGLNGENKATTAVIKKEESKGESEPAPRVPGLSSAGSRPLTNGHVPAVSSPPPPHHHRHPLHHLHRLNPLHPHFVPQDRFRFNSDLMCPHGNLCTQEGRRRLVPEKVSLFAKLALMSSSFMLYICLQ